MTSAVKAQSGGEAIEALTGNAFTGLADALLPAVLAAGRVELAYFSSPVEVVTKSDDTPVTAADREAEAILLKALETIAPGVPVVAEEATASGVVITHPGDCFFLVDPLDGTREFISRRGEFTINVALIRGGKPVFGLIYAPVSGDLYVTLAPDRAVHARLTPDANPESLTGLTLTPIFARQPQAEGLIAVVSRSHMNKSTEDYLATLPIRERLAAGSSLKFCRVAAGDADIYPRVGATSEWDIAAGHAILNAAGGTLTAMDGTELRYGKVDEKYRNPSYVARGLLPSTRAAA